VSQKSSNSTAKVSTVHGWGRKCPYEFEVTKDDRLIIEGEDYGNAQASFDEGDKVIDAIRIWHKVSQSEQGSNP